MAGQAFFLRLKLFKEPAFRPDIPKAALLPLLIGRITSRKQP
jgi:hypothetical protein